jgi:four helix bundle protein
MVAIAVHRHAATSWRPANASIFDQLRRASLSVHLKIAEGFALGPGPRCRQHLRIAYGSAVETTELLEFLVELAPEQTSVISNLIKCSKETQALTLRLWLKSRA